MKTRGIWEKMMPARKYNFSILFLFCFVYNIFAVLYLRIRLFALLTAGKGNGTGVYAEISFHKFYHFSFYLFIYLFISFILFSFYFSFTFFYPRHLPTPTPTTHDPHPRPTTSTHDPRPTTFSYTQLKLEPYDKQAKGDVIWWSATPRNHQIITLQILLKKIIYTHSSVSGKSEDTMMVSCFPQKAYLQTVLGMINSTKPLTNYSISPFPIL